MGTRHDGCLILEDLLCYFRHVCGCYLNPSWFVGSNTSGLGAVRRFYLLEGRVFELYFRSVPVLSGARARDFAINAKHEC
jgi:hypothetical protein